jgi:hypothetical protein
MICRWDESTVSILLEYLRKFYLKLLSHFKEMEISLKPNEKYRMSYTIESVHMFLSNVYLCFMLLVILFPGGGCLYMCVHKPWFFQLYFYI